MALFSDTPRTRHDQAAIGLGPVGSLMFILGATWLLPAGTQTALLTILLMAYLVMSPGRANNAALRLALPFLVMVGWALMFSFDNDSYDVSKDIWYGLKVPLCLMLGFLVGIRSTDSRTMMNAFCWLAGMMALINILVWMRYGGSIGDLDTEDRSRLPLVAVIGIIPLLDRAYSTVGIERGKALGLLLLILIAVAISNSRITIVIALVMACAWAGLLSNTLRAIIGGAILLAIIAILWQYLPVYTGGELTLALKIRRSIEEIGFTDGLSHQEMLLNWRGFEAYNAQIMFENSYPVQRLFGNGLGSSVDLGQELFVSNSQAIRFLPILHNGYYYIVLKYGMVGVFVYVTSVLRFGFLGKLTLDNLSLPDRMLRGIIVSIFLATTVITGLYNKTELNGIMIFVAWLVGFAQRQHYDRIVFEEIRPYRSIGTNG